MQLLWNLLNFEAPHFALYCLVTITRRAIVFQCTIGMTTDLSFHCPHPRMLQSSLSHQEQAFTLAACNCAGRVITGAVTSPVIRCHGPNDSWSVSAKVPLNRCLSLTRACNNEVMLHAVCHVCRCLLHAVRHVCRWLLHAVRHVCWTARLLHAVCHVCRWLLHAERHVCRIARLLHEVCHVCRWLLHAERHVCRTARLLHAVCHVCRGNCT